MVLNVHQKSTGDGQKKPTRNYKIVDDETWASCYKDIRQCPRDYELHGMWVVCVKQGHIKGDPGMDNFFFERVGGGGGQ